MQITADYVLFTIDKEFEDEIKLSNGMSLYKDVSYDPGRHKRIYGTVVSVPSKLTGEAIIKENDPGLPRPQRYISHDTIVEANYESHLSKHDYVMPGGSFDEAAYNSAMRSHFYNCTLFEPDYVRSNAIPIELLPGERIYFNYSATNRENLLCKTTFQKDGKDIYIIPYHQIWCKVTSSGEIKALSGHTLVKPIEDTENETLLDTATVAQVHGGVIESLGKKDKYLQGVVCHIPTPFKGEEIGFKIGDTVAFMIARDWENTIEGHKFYVMKYWDIEAIIG